MGRRARRRQREVETVIRQLAGADQDDGPDLARLVSLRRRLDDDIRAEVLRLRSAGASWAVLGRALGTSRQAARQRFGEADSAR